MFIIATTAMMPTTTQAQAPIAGTGLTWQLSAGVLTILYTGTGVNDMPNYASPNHPWLSNAASITSVVIGVGVTSIGNFAFQTCNSLVSITFLGTTPPQTIGNNAFLGTHTNLKIYLPLSHGSDISAWTATGTLGNAEINNLSGRTQLFYVVTVVDGTSSGNFYSDEIVNITANQPPTGYRFSHWSSSPTVTFANANSASTSFIMPARAVTVTTNYAEMYTLTVKVSGSGIFRLDGENYRDRTLHFYYPPSPPFETVTL